MARSDVFSKAKPYVEHALQDEKVRKNLQNAFEAAKHLYDKAGKKGVGHVAHGVVSDKHVQENLRTAVHELRSAVHRLEKREEAHKARNSLLLLLGVGAVLAFNPVTGPEVRRFLKGHLFGDRNDEFGYDSGSGNGSSAD
jgi:uncharacterized protein (UPF0147 family)